MSTNNLRFVAAGAAVILAVLTGILAGIAGASGGNPCTITNTVQVTVDQDHRQLSKQTLPGVPSGDCEASNFSVGTAAVGFLGAGIAGGLAVGFLFLARRPEDPGATAAVPAAAPADGVLARQLEQTQAERGTLVQTCIYVRDRATSKAIADRLGWALQEVGVSTVAPTGVTFDPAHHEAGGSTATAERAKVGTIAAVEVPGYVDRGVVVRAPVVTVYREERA
jgi:GrpE protein